MKNEARATICGQLGADLKIKETKNGRMYGVLLVAVNKNLKQSGSDEWVSKTHWFRIHVWNQDILDNAGLLKKGEKVLVIGELKPLRKGSIAEDGVSVIGQHSGITINIKSKSDITVLKKNFPTIEEKRNSITEVNSGIEEKVA